jgi:hypothetical protein
LSSRPRSRARRRAASPAPVDLFAPPPAADPDADDPVVLSRTATLASGRAMAAQRWAEARALAALAETYARLARLAGRTLNDERDREPTEAEFEAVRRKVMGWDEAATHPPYGLDAGSEAADGTPCVSAS